MKASRRARHRTLGDRVLTWMAILALITLIAGIAGAWFSYQPEPGITVIGPDRLNATPSLKRVESRLTRMEKRLSHILDPYIRRLNNLGSELANTREQLIEHIRNTEQQQVTTTTGFEGRLEDFEQRLAATDERMDALSTMLVALAEGTPKSAPATDNAVLRTAPATTDSPGTGEVAALAAQHQTPRFTPVPELEATASRATDTPAPAEPTTPEPAAQQPVATAPADSQTATTPEPVPETQPEPATQQPVTAAPAKSETATAPPEPVPETQPEPAAQQPVTAAPAESETATAPPEPVPVTRPEPAAQQPVTAAPAENQTATAPEPVPETRPEAVASVAAGPAAVTAKGNWAINIASYTNERIARRQLAKMQQQGVDVELVTAEVNGKTIYRARVFGFASRRAANAAATEIQSKLGLEEIWITKR